MKAHDQLVGKKQCNGNSRCLARVGKSELYDLSISVVQRRTAIYDSTCHSEHVTSISGADCVTCNWMLTKPKLSGSAPKQTWPCSVRPQICCSVRVGSPTIKPSSVVRDLWLPSCQWSNTSPRQQQQPASTVFNDCITYDVASVLRSQSVWCRHCWCHGWTIGTCWFTNIITDSIDHVTSHDAVSAAAALAARLLAHSIQTLHDDVPHTHTRHLNDKSSFLSLGNIRTCTTLRQHYKLYSAASAHQVRRKCILLCRSTGMERSTGQHLSWDESQLLQAFDWLSGPIMKGDLIIAILTVLIRRSPISL